MSLDVDAAPSYLLERGLIEPAAVVAGDLRVRSVLRRNRNLRVERRRGPGYQLKQPDPTEGGGERTLAAEAAFYTLCRDEPAAAPAAAFLPRLIDHDPAGPRLVFELLGGARTLWEELEAHPPEAPPAEHWHAFGSALGTVHATFRAPALVAHPFLAGLGAAPPWTLSLHRPGAEILAWLSPAHRSTLRILQSEEELGARLDALQSEWRGATDVTLLHGDLKLDHVLVLPGRPGSPIAARLVDWELVQRGDPAWDVAAVLHEAVRFWVHHMPQEADLVPEERIARARYPLAALQAGLRAFWPAYRQAADLTPAAAAGLLLRAVPYSAARLVQSAYEQARASERLQSAAVLILQVAANVLANPTPATFHLYGLPVRPAVG